MEAGSPPFPEGGFFAFHLSCAGKAQSQSQGTVKLHRVFVSRCPRTFWIGACTPGKLRPHQGDTRGSPDGDAIMPSGVARVSTLPPRATYARSAPGVFLVALAPGASTSANSGPSTFGSVLVPRGNCVPIRGTPEGAPDGIAIMPLGVARVSTLPPGASFSRSTPGFRSGGPPTTGDPSRRGHLLHHLPPPD
ncbi:hypothetical protein GUJ93_ZPchr0007g3495 [Zizania palustris]|uniref:Uncharacterized protein n=1 Tax=Zizania palustris TaxID=103762 RepID=A0A8J5T6J9_ZIZPA|nr:hypothetical protein GUJ93_ZPchr0007g3495 [Zizania palustris]